MKTELEAATTLAALSATGAPTELASARALAGSPAEPARTGSPVDVAEPELRTA
jgi:hypothetical protein